MKWDKELREKIWGNNGYGDIFSIRESIDVLCDTIKEAGLPDDVQESANTLWWAVHDLADNLEACGCTDPVFDKED